MIFSIECASKEAIARASRVAGAQLAENFSERKAHDFASLCSMPDYAAVIHGNTPGNLFLVDEVLATWPLPMYMATAWQS